MFPVNKKLACTSRNEGLTEKYAPVVEQTASTGSC